MSSKINANNSVDGVSISADSSGILELQTKGVTAITIDGSQNVTIPFKQTGTGAVARTLDAKVKESISVLDFGADPTGVVDSSSAIQNAINSLSVGQGLFINKGTYLCTSTLTINQPISFFGESSTGTILKFSGCDGIVIAHDSSDIASNEVLNLSITTVDSGLYTGLSFTSVESSAAKMPRIILEHLRVSGFSINGSTENQWLTAISLNSADKGYINEITIKGRERIALDNYIPSTVGLYINNSTVFTLNAISLIRLKTGLYLTGQSEGMMFTNSQVVAVYSGVIMEGLVSPSNNIQIHNVHMAPAYEGLRIDPCTNGTLSGMHFFSNMFILKRTDVDAGGFDNYKAFSISAERSSFNNIATQTNYGGKDSYATGEMGFYLHNNSINNSFTNIAIYNPGLGFKFDSGSSFNIVTSCNMVKGSSYTQVPYETVSNTNFIDVLYESVRSNIIGNGGYKYKTASGTTLSIGDKLLSMPIEGAFMSIGNPAVSGSSYFDFNTSGNSNDYDVRIGVSGGGVVSGNGNLAISANTTSLTGTLTLTNGSLFLNKSNGSIELGNTTASNTPFIDFHSSGNNIDYDARIMVSGGSATLGQGTITFSAANLTTSASMNLTGNVGIGGNAVTGSGLNISTALSLATGIGSRINGVVQADNTSAASYYQTSASSVSSASPYTTPSIYHYQATQGTFGTNSTITNQFGFAAGASLIGATNNYGFYGGIPAATNRYNFYAAGTAANYFAGDMQFGKTVTAIGTTGAVTIDKTCGTANFATYTTSATLIVTNNLVTANSIIICTIGTSGTGMTTISAVAGSGSFTLTALGTTTATTRVNFLVIN